uniref:Microtubule-associated protein 9 n=1 Tax=Hippocampus comes TaxID=109280 RepID=A0A3Q3DQN1_HIPCM
DMTNQAFDILAYSQSPKTTKRTTFQVKGALCFDYHAWKMDSDFLGNLLKSRRNRSDAFKASKTKSQINDFDFSDDDEKQGTKNRTSFLKSLKRLSVEGDLIAPQHEHETLNSCQLSSEGDIGHKKNAVKLASHCPPRDNSSTSLLSQSDDVPLDLPFPFHSSTSPRETPKPKPRQRTLGLNIHVTEKTETSPPAPITDISTPEKITTRSCSPHVRHFTSYIGVFPFYHCPSSLSFIFFFISFRAPSSQSQRRNTVRAKKVESKYLGSLKILDCKISPNCQPQAVDSLRATVYQVSGTMTSLAFFKKKEKKKGAANSYEAWKEKKDEMLKAKTKEDKHRLREEQKAVEEVQEKRKAAEQVFHQWKREHDDVLREKCRQQKATEKKLALKKHEEEEERKTASKSAFSDWCEKKTDALYKKVTIKRQENKNKAEENRYIQEEKDKMAVEMFEQWLAKKEIQQKRQREEKRLQVILRDSPPPPWSPPNKTIQFRK